MSGPGLAQEAGGAQSLDSVSPLLCRAAAAKHSHPSPFQDTRHRRLRYATTTNTVIQNGTQDPHSEVLAVSAQQS